MFCAWLCVVNSSDYVFLNIVSANLLRMICICWTWVKLGFVKCFKRGTLQKSERKVLREVIFEIKNVNFLIIYVTH